MINNAHNSVNLKLPKIKIKWKLNGKIFNWLILKLRKISLIYYKYIKTEFLLNLTY